MPMAPGPAADGERILLLECRLEQLRSALDQARADADGARVKLAEAAAREAEHARRYGVIQQELAEARAEIASVHERLDRSEALRAELEGHLFEAGARGDAAELVRLRREVLAQRQRAVINERTCTRLRARVDELRVSRETLLTRVAEWQRLIQKEGPAAADLAEFMAELRGDILHLEHRNAAGERQEAALRERLVRAGLDPDEPAAEHVPPALVEALEGQPVPELLSLEHDVLDVAVPVDDKPAPARSTTTSEVANVAAPAAPAAARDASQRGTAARDEATSDVATSEAATSEATPDAARARGSGAEPTGKREVESNEVVDLFDAPSATAEAEGELHSSSRRAELGRGVRAQPTRTNRAGPESVDAVPDDADERQAPDSPPAPPAPEKTGSMKATDPVDAAVERTTPSVADAAAAASAAEREQATDPTGVPPVEGLQAADPSARAAAYERLIRVLENDPARLARNLQPGLADPHPRVRRRAVLAAATCQRLPLHPLLEPLQRDPDPHVRRVVREVLRHASRTQRSTGDEDDAVPASARVLTETRS